MYETTGYIVDFERVRDLFDRADYARVSIAPEDGGPNVWVPWPRDKRPTSGQRVRVTIEEVE